jgi:hypothetical protein
MRRLWPAAFLALLVALFAVHVTPPPQQPARMPRRREIAEIPSDPARSEPPTRPQPPAPAAPNESAVPESPSASRSPTIAGLLWALRHQNEDGSWGDVPTTLGDRTIGRTGVTSLVLLSLVGAGYSHLSRDEYDGIVVGTQVRKALQWLLAQQREDGSFRSSFDNQFDAALASLAICETYGSTSAPVLKEPAERAIDALVRLQGADGSWGGSTVTPWALQALVSARLNEVLFPSAVQERALDYLRNEDPAHLLEGRMMCRDRRDLGLTDALAQQIASSDPRAGVVDVEALSHQSLGLFMYDGPGGPLWTAWAPGLRDALLSGQNRDGSWSGGSGSHRLARTALAEFSLQVYYRYANVFAAAR